MYKHFEKEEQNISINNGLLFVACKKKKLGNKKTQILKSQQ